jgi:ferrous iron transport protein A
MGESHIISLSKLPVGRPGVVTEIELTKYACKFLCLGVHVGCNVTIKRKAPFGGAFYLMVNEHQIAIREEEAETIKVMIV